MKNRKLSARAVVSLMLSAILFCMPIGAFFANRTNTIEVHAEDTAEQKTESASDAENTVTPGNGREENSGTDTGEGKTENSTEGTTEDSSEETQPAAKCTCKEKCSQYAVDEDCEVCAKNYKECTYINPSVKITINTPSGWHNDTTKVIVKVEDTIVSGNFTVQTVKAKVGQNGSWTDITEDMYIEISENSTIYVQVTDQKGKTYEKNRYIKCFDFTKPTLNAAVSDGLLSIQAHDTDSGIKASNHGGAPQISVVPLSSKLKDNPVHVIVDPSEIRGYALSNRSDFMPEDIQTLNKGCVRFKSGYIPGESEIREAMDRAMIMQLNLLPVARKMVLEELEMKQNG